MQLVEAGKIALDTPVQHYLPWFTLANPQVASQLTVRQLLNQTSGLTQTTGWVALANFDNSPDASENRRVRWQLSSPIVRLVRCLSTAT